MSDPGKARMICACLGALEILCLAIPISFSRDGPQQQPLNEANKLLRNLYRDRFANARDHLTPEQARGLQHEIELTVPKVKGLVDEGIIEELNRALPPLPDVLARELNHSLEVTNYDGPPSAAVLSFGGPARPTYVIAYLIGYGAVQSLSSINVYGVKHGRYELIAQANNPLPNRTLVLTRLPAVGNRESAFLAHGIYWGDPHNHLSVIAYAFDGHHLNTLFTRTDLVQGQVKVEGDKIALNFLTIARGPGYPPAPLRTEIYRVSRSGVSLQSASETKPGG